LRAGTIGKAAKDCRTCRGDNDDLKITIGKNWNDSQINPEKQRANFAKLLLRHNNLLAK
jgi:hypothetical protein